MAPEFVLLDDYTVPGYGLKASLSLKLKDEDASGDSSTTSKAKKGTKGKSLEVKTFIRFKDEKDLRELYSKAEAVAGGDGTLYTITNRTANATGMRQGRFSGDMKAEPQDGLAAWLVSFTLAEHLSVPERKEKREVKPEATTQQNTGSSIVPPPEPEKEPELDWLQRRLKALDTTLGGSK